jgi:hypothetical protein
MKWLWIMSVDEGEWKYYDEHGCGAAESAAGQDHVDLATCCQVGGQPMHQILWVLNKLILRKPNASFTVDKLHTAHTFPTHT